MQRKSWRMSCDVGKATEGLENELWRRWSDGRAGEWAELIVIVIAIFYEIVFIFCRSMCIYDYDIIPSTPEY